MKKLNKYHWEFFINNDGIVEVYEQCDGDVIGCIDCFNVEYIDNYTKDFTEQQVYDFIDSVIDYY